MTGLNKTKAEKLASGEKSRKEYLRTRTARNANPLVDLPAPKVSGIIDSTDGTLNKDVLTAPLAFSLEGWLNRPELPGDTNDITLQWAHKAPPVGDDDYRDFPPINIDETELFPITRFTVPMEEFEGDGAYSFRYKVRLTNQSTETSTAIALICDRKEPWWQDEPPVLELPTETITDAYLDDNDDGVIGTIPTYSDWQLGDIAYFYMDNKVPEDPPTINPIATMPVTKQNETYTFEGDAFRALEDGRVYIIYVLIDKATNRSRISHIAQLDVALGPWPSGLQPPVVPLASGVGGDDLIDLKDAVLGVTVEIPLFAGKKATDFIEITWGATVLPLEQIGSRPFPLSILVPAQLMLKEWNNATSEKPTDVSYRVLRGAVEAGTEKVTINVDFTYIGPTRPDPDPDWPDPINYFLPALIVTGKGANPEPNKLNRLDAKLPATLQTRFYNPLNEDEEITFYWDDEQVTEATYTVTDTDLSGAPFSVDIPWSYIEARGNGNVPVQYRISSPETPNEQYSMPGMVEVDAITLVPVAPTFLGLVGDWLNCASLSDLNDPHPLDPAIRVQMPDLTQYNVVMGAKVKMHWIAHEGRTGADNPIPGTEYEEEITLDVDHPPTGFVWRIQPYEDYILPTYRPPSNSSCRGRVNYSFVLGSETFTSEEVEAFVGMYVAESGCIFPVP